MAAKNDITGDTIKSKILSLTGRENYDNIFKKTAKQWFMEIVGFPGSEAVPLDDHTLISRTEFNRLLVEQNNMTQNLPQDRSLFSNKPKDNSLFGPDTLV